MTHDDTQNIPGQRARITDIRGRNGRSCGDASETLHGYGCRVVCYGLFLTAHSGEFLAPNDPNEHNTALVYAPPQRLRFVGEEGFSLRPFVYGYKVSGSRHSATCPYD